MSRPFDPSPFVQYDGLGRRIPRRLGIETYLLMIAQMEPARVRRVPAAAVVEEGEDDESRYAFVRCPCQSHVVARESLQKCDDCERYYVHVALGSTWVVYGAMTPPRLPSLPV